MPLNKFLPFLLLLAAFASCQAQDRRVVNTDPAGFSDRLQQHDGVLLDVRTPEEYAEGHIAGARLMNIYDPAFRDSLATLDTARTVYVYCRSGNRSSQAVKIMEESGFSRIIHLEHGFSSWQADGRPVEK